MQIYNTLSGAKETLRTIREGELRMYVCGATVYDYCHVGHARVFVVFDMVARYLRERGYAVTYVRNVTDIDDKIIRRAEETGESPQALSERFTVAMHEDLERLGVQPPDIEPRATAHIGDIVAMIEQLVAGDYAYAADNGDVYFAVQHFADYGRLSGRDPAELRAGARVEVNEAKRDPLDFVLWKAAKPGEPAWSSPWGEGRPGWHIECSAMSTRHLGEYFDIHGGGRDLMFPHHENEIAQSCAANGASFVRYWMHNGFVRIDDEKMSKSLGNFFTIREVLERYAPEVLRYFLLSSHYRSPLNYSDQALDQAREALTRLYLGLAEAGTEAAVEPLEDALSERFHAAMADDFNTPEALAVLFEVVRALNKTQDAAQRAARAAQLRQLGGVLGLLAAQPQEFLRGGAGQAGDDEESARIDAMVSEREQARQAKDFARADALRDELTAMGILLEDGAGGTRWRRG